MNNQLRKKLIDLHFKKQSIHLGSSLSCLDILSSLLLDVNIFYRDVILSKGHASTALYVVLNELGVLSNEELETYFENGTFLAAHPVSNSGFVDFGTGSLGHGVSLAAGKAKARKLKGDDNPVVCIVSDGEMNEGSVYEGINFAIQHQLNNLIIIVDNNGLQGLGDTTQVLGDLSQTFAHRKGLNYLEVDGHNSFMLKQAVSCPSEFPTFINAKTIKGKGVSFAENNNDWHYAKLSEANYQSALTALND